MRSGAVKAAVRRGAVALVLATAPAGCYEEHQPPPPTQAPSPPAPVDQPPAGGRASGAGGQPGSALGGARQAGHNTVDRIQERQDELEKALEEN
jgi:hypothetical protein